MKKIVNKMIKVNGKEYPCRILMGAMLRFKRQTGRDVSEMSPTDTADLITFLWCCVASSCNADGVEFGLSLEDFADGLDAESFNSFYADQAEETEEQKKSPEKSQE